jgi:sulfate adenylyltransferase
MATAKTCPHPPSQHMALSGTQLRAMLAAGQAPPPEFTRPEVAALLLDADQP